MSNLSIQHDIDTFSDSGFDKSSVSDAYLKHIVPFLPLYATVLTKTLF